MITPLGRNTAETFEHASQGRSGIDYLKAFDTRGLPVRIGGEVSDEWIQRPAGVAGRLERTASRAVQLMWTAAMEAAEQSKLGRIRDRYRIGGVLRYHGETSSPRGHTRLFRAGDGRGQWDSTPPRRA